MRHGTEDEKMTREKSPLDGEMRRKLGVDNIILKNHHFSVAGMPLSLDLEENCFGTFI